MNMAQAVRAKPSRRSRRTKLTGLRMVAARTTRLSMMTTYIAFQRAILIDISASSPGEWHESLDNYRTWEIVDASSMSQRFSHQRVVC